MLPIRLRKRETFLRACFHGHSSRRKPVGDILREAEHLINFTFFRSLNELRCLFGAFPGSFTEGYSDCFYLPNICAAAKMIRKRFGNGNDEHRLGTRETRRGAIKSTLQEARGLSNMHHLALLIAASSFELIGA